jgi:hypothetical protein
VKIGGCPDAWQRWPRDVAASALFVKEFATARAARRDTFDNCHIEIMVFGMFRADSQPLFAV